MVLQPQRRGGDIRISLSAAHPSKAAHAGPHALTVLLRVVLVHRGILPLRDELAGQLVEEPKVVRHQVRSRPRVVPPLSNADGRDCAWFKFPAPDEIEQKH